MSSDEKDASGASPEAFSVPAFARDFPADPALDALVLAFSKGDYTAVARGAAKLERSAESEALRRAARMLRDRTRPAPAAAVLIVVSALLLALLSLWWTLGPGAHGK